VDSKEYVNPFIDVHRKAEAIRKRTREERDKDVGLREERLKAAARDLDLTPDNSGLKAGVMRFK
jgi:hypothetical protein